MKYLAPLLSLLLFFPGTGCCQEVEKTEIKTYKLTETLYMLEGSGGNIGVSIGPDGTFLIDDQYAPLTQKIKTALAAITSHPVKFIINTHYHGDHTGGNENFAGEGAIILSHKNTRQRIEADQLKSIEPDEKSSYAGVGLPRITFTESITFHHNGEVIDSYYFGNAHTDGDVIIHFTKANVFHMGDTYVRYGLPYIDAGSGGTIMGMIYVLDQVLALANEESRFIPGHGQAASRQEVIVFKMMLETIFSRVKDQVAQGKTLEEILSSEPTSGFEKQGVDAGDFVKGIYLSLKK